MKRFIRSIAGKIIMFFFFIVSALTLTACIAGVYFYNDSESSWSAEWYNSSKEACIEKMTGKVVEGFANDVMLKEFLNFDIEDDFEYWVTDEYGKVIAETPGFRSITEKKYTADFGILRTKQGEITDFFYHSPLTKKDDAIPYYSVSLVPKPQSAAFTELERALLFANIAYELRYAIYGIALAALAVMILTFIGLIDSAGRRNKTEEIVVAPLCKFPFDLLLGALCIGFVCAIYAADLYLNRLELIFVGIAIYVAGIICAVFVCMISATNVKRKMFIKNLLIYKICHFIWVVLKKIWSGIEKIPLIWKTTLGVAVIAAWEFFIIVLSDGNQETFVICWFFLKLVVIPIVLYIAYMLKKLETGGKALANGNLAYKTDTKGMILDLKNHGENLNSIASGMTRAVEARLKSERMKTELITNVSHDIKTPLTSIINYASLIGNELKDKDDEKLSEYSEVLVRQSESLKRLIEDLVEASKASSGNLDVALAPCDASIFISQASGEYEEKLKKTDLTLVTKESPEELYIMADGRRMWRIFDNLMNNICKYALPGTRVYLSLERFSDRALITFKNTSKEPLDMTEEELMERFTRGDSSRHTEGNGLGLSIARSLAELQNGQLRLALDGDLFKAILSFPLVEKPAEAENGNE
jgi:signal transduction histidine kinase